MDLNELRSILFNQLKVLNDPNLSKDKLKDALKTAQGVTNIADTIIAAGRLELDCMKLMERKDPLTPLFPKDSKIEVERAVRMAVEARLSWSANNPEKVRELTAAQG